MRVGLKDAFEDFSEDLVVCGALYGPPGGEHPGRSTVLGDERVESPRGPH